MEVDQPEDVLAGLAVKREPDHGPADSHHCSGREIVKPVAADDDVFTEVTGTKPAIRGDRLRGDQDLAKRRAGDIASDTLGAVLYCRHGPHSWRPLKNKSVTCNAPSPLWSQPLL